METAFVSIICIALLVIGSMTMSRGFLASVDNTSININQLSQRSEEKMRTNLEVLSITELAKNRLTITCQNTGQTKLSDFPKWDIIVHYTDNNDVDYVAWLPYVATGPGDNEWLVKGIYTSTGSNEVFEPGILNTDEKIVIEAQVDPKIKTGSTNMAVISTQNGVTVTKTFIGN